MRLSRIAPATVLLSLALCGTALAGPGGKGMTWKLISTNAPTGTVRVGCSNCNGYQGDTPCTTALPILCIRKSGPGFPLPKPASVNDTDIYYKWSGGIVGTTAPTPAPAKRSEANALCVREFGADWRVAEHHDGWGWHLQAFGGVGNPAQNFWADVNDQPNGVCWQ
jgi:hypothetical protein